MTDKYYKILGLPRNSSKREIRDTYIRLIKKHHPDVGGNIERFLAIQEAYKNLINMQDKVETDKTDKKEFKRAYMLYKRKRYVESAAILRNYLLNNDTDTSANFLYAKLMKKFGKFRNAEKYFKKIIDMENYNTDAMMELASLYREIGLKSYAVNILKKLLKWNENNREAVQMLEQLEQRSFSLKTIFKKTNNS